MSCFCLQVFGRDAYDAELVNAWHSYLQSVQAQILTEQIADIVPLLVACPIEAVSLLWRKRSL